MNFQLSSEGQEFVKKELKRYETKESAIIPCLFRVQKENAGWVSSESVGYLSQLMDIPEARINEVFQFYTMFNQVPVGKYHVQVCCNVACCMAGTREIIEEFCKEHNVAEGDVTSDKRFTFTRVECLGACDKAPMMQINDDYYEDLTMDSAKQILRGLK